MTYKSIRFYLLAIICGLLVGGTYHWAADTKSAGLSFSRSLDQLLPKSANQQYSFHTAVAAASPAVVSIYTEQFRSSNGNRSLEDLLGKAMRLPLTQVSTNQGSGVIISEQGHIITNEHLIENSDSITVILSDGRQFAARKLGADPVTDLAVLKIDSPKRLPQLRFADSTTPRVGDIVLAIGSPYGIGQTVTMGIVSATGRRNVTDTPLQDFIQIDAAINPGNSGGALVNPNGELIGINTAIFAPEDGAQGIGFAVPLRLVNYVVPQIIEHHQVRRGWLGVQVDDLLYYPELRRHHRHGVVITGIIENSPADALDLQIGDILTHIGEKQITSAHQLLLEATTTLPGTEVQILGKRQNNEFRVTTTFSARPN